ncbi:MULTISPECIES: IgG-binding virulence factor TspB family protein [unclassified Neisseria]|uniref:IgG-binding virulence factor TspB family protein n=1 Tax=unclassified Neisseria TaxID=2623750 RepID=UPI00206ED96D|nr:MAG TPA: attachment protein [Inoviridae sp.]
MLRVLTIIFLLGLSFESFAGDLQVRNGKLAYPLTEKFNENGFRPWKIIGGGIDQEYQSRFDKSLHVREASTGLRSASTVPVTIEAQVSRKAVLSGAFGLVKAGAKLGLKAVPYVGAAAYAYDAYQVVKYDLEFEGYKWNEASEEFLKEWPARNCIWVRDESDRVQDVACYGVDSSVLNAYRKGGKSQREAEELMKGQMEKLAGPFWEKRKKELDKDLGSKFWEYYHLDKCLFDLNGGGCSVKRGSDVRSSVSFRLKMRDTQVLDQETFLKISTNSIDSNPTPFVEGTGKPEYNEKVSVPAGTVVTIGPVTPENGKPVQITITFGQDSNGNTTAEVATTQRPDLDPGSPEAPNKKPDGNPDSNPDGKPDKKPDGNPDGKPDKKPDDKPDPDGKDDPKKDERPKEDDKPKEDGGLLCKVFPNILACDELPEKEEPNLEIPQETIDLNFTPDNTFKEYGECPAPVTFQALGAEYKISLEPACNLAAMMRPFIIAMAWLVASFFVARVVRNNA